MAEGSLLKYANTDEHKTEWIRVNYRDKSTFAQLNPSATYHREQVYAEPPLDVCPEKKLLIAMLKEAIFCLSWLDHPNDHNKKMAVEAAEWMEEEAHDVFAFNSVCEALGLEPSCVRKQYKDHLARRRPYVPRRVQVPADPKATHEYRGSIHCKECKARYDTAYQRQIVGRRPVMGAPQKEINPTHDYVSQKHCRDCCIMWQRDYKNRQQGGQGVLPLRKRGRKPGQPPPVAVSRRFFINHKKTVAG